MKRPLIGVTPDIEYRPDASPPRNGYFTDEQTFATLHAAGAITIMLPHNLDAVDHYLDLIDGLLVTGGGYQFRHPKLFSDDGSEPTEKQRRTRFEAALLRRAIDRDLATLAVCGGFQTLNMVAGGDLVTVLADVDPSWSRHRAPGYNSAMHPVNIVAGTRLAEVVGTASFTVNTLHFQGVLQTGPGAIVSARSDDGVVEAIEVPGKRFCIGTQWHPEFLLSAPEHRLFEGFVEASRR